MAKDLRPSSVVDNPGFCYMVNTYDVSRYVSYRDLCIAIRIVS